uniref:Uncharacterized protein n=1 Tax=Arundo donax TaxID=35708 RepID=A0A0A9FTX7_ARUDO
MEVEHAGTGQGSKD